MRIIHTSEMESGQIYIPVINWTLYISVVLVIIGFEHSSNLAYGIAAVTMVLTSILVTSVAINNWHWNRFPAIGIVTILLIIDVPMFSANALKCSPAAGCR